MKLTYDPRYNVAYLQLQETANDVKTLQISDDLNIDIAPDGKVLGIEFLNANEQLRAGSDANRLIVLNEATQREQTVIIE